METRIKVVETLNGDKTYHVEKKGLEYTWGEYLFPLFGWVQYFSDKYDWTKLHNYGNCEFKTLELAKNEIDTYLAKIESKKLAKYGSKVVKVEYVKHP